MGKTIAMLNLTETRRDPRVRRIASCLAAQGHKVVVFGIKSEITEPSDQVENFEVRRVDIPLDYSDVVMSKIAHYSKEAAAAAAVIRGCKRSVMSSKIQIQLKEYRDSLRRTFKIEPPPEEAKFNSEIYAIRSIMLINLNLYYEALKIKPDVVHSNDLDTLLAGFMLKKRFSIPLVFDAHEIYPEQLAEHMRSEIWHSFYTRLEKALLPHTDGRMTVCDSLGDYFVRAYRSRSFTTIRNLVSIRHLADHSVLERSNKPVRVLYHGAYFPYRGLDEIIKAAAFIKNAVFVFRGIGNYEETLRRMVADAGLENRITFEPPVGVNDLVSSASSNDIGLNPFISVCKNTEYALPNKFFEYMMAGLAVASSDLVEMRRLTERLGIGVLFKSDDISSIASSLDTLVNDFDALRRARRNAYAAARDEYNWEQEQKKFLEFYGPFL